MSTQEFTDVEALRQQCTKIRQLAMEALNGAIQRRDAVLNEVRQEEQRLATIAAERCRAEESLSTYRQHFRPLFELAAPRASMAVRVVCAETTAEARRIASSFALQRLRMEQGRLGRAPTDAAGPRRGHHRACRRRLRSAGPSWARSADGGA